MSSPSTRDLRKSTENFVVFGTAFPEPTEKDKRAGRSDAGQFVPVWKQEARDEKGRRRFHGAFTGGFSAGYFNTVGSKEGWEPANYVSSRSARSERKETRPEDFMDEEDLEDMANARKIVATEEFDILGGTERELAARRQQQEEAESGGVGAASFIGSSLMNMFGPPKDSVGVRLLRRMGWRPGQGIGPRVKRRLIEQDEEDEEEGFLNDITFAPHDTPIENYQPKRDNYGLGFDLMNAAPEVAEMKRLRELARREEMDGTTTNKRNRSAFGVLESTGSKTEAFGLGAFEVDDDDEDIYKNDFKPSHYHTALYDNDEGMTADELQRLKRQKREVVSNDMKSSTTKCSDGLPPLKGFHVAEKNQQLGKWYPPPQVPADFNEKHKAVLDDNKDAKTTKISSDSIFSFEERAHALGEKPIEHRSVFDYIPKHSKDKLDQAVSWFLDAGKDKSQLSDFPQVPKDVAQLALKGFIPFGDNPQKQARYKQYLENQAGLTADGTPKTVLPIPEGLTYETGMKELEEFAKAARIFRPISAMMSGRFTSASNPSKVEAIQFEGGLKSEAEYRKQKEQQEKALVEPKAKPSQEAEAAALKMFGNLTRTIKPFYPTRLVCKRFNVRNPHPDHHPGDEKLAGRTQAGSRDVLNKDSMESMLNERMPLKFTTSSTTTEILAPTTVNDPLLSAVIPKPSDRQQTNNEIATTAPITGIDSSRPKRAEEEEEDENNIKAMDYERPSMDIFKAIFENSDSEEEEEDAVEQEMKENKVEKRNDAVLRTSTVETQNDTEELIGPLPPPPSSITTVSLEKEVAERADTAGPTFRPMFKRRQERQEEHSAPLTNIISEEVIVQPFKPRAAGQKRRHVHVTEDENESDKEEKEEFTKSSINSDSSKRSEKKHRSGSSRHRHHHKSSSSSSSRKRSQSRSRSRSRSDRDRKKKRSKSRDRHSKHRRHKSDKHSDKSSKTRAIDLLDLEEMWVEKEPVVTDDSNKKSKRMTAADMW